MNTNKYLIIVQVGSRHEVYGALGAKTIECVQVFYHNLKNRYCSFLRSPVAGKRLFLMSLIDVEVRKALGVFLRAVAKNPLRLFDRIYAQTIHLQQPYEILNGSVNLCDDCPNMMIHDGRLIASCRLDEYRMLGGLITPVLSRESVLTRLPAQERVEQ